jgi:nucleoporin NUP42
MLLRALIPYVCPMSQVNDANERQNARSNVQQAYEVATKQSPVASIVNPGNNSIFNKPATSAFGAQTTSAFDAPKSAFGQPAFGQTGFGTTSSPFGQQASASTMTGTFGQPVQPPSNFDTPAFGQPSQPQSGLVKPASGAFSNFATGPSAFGATAGSGSTGGGFGAFAKQPTPFGLAAAGPTGGSAFGQPSFGAPSAFAPVVQQQQPPPPPPPQTQSAFGGFSQPTTSAFGATTQSAFGAPSMQPQPFGSANVASPQSAFAAVQSPPQPQPHPMAFSAFGPSSTTTTTTSAFGQPLQQQPSGFAGFGQGSSPFGTSQPPPSTALPEPPSSTPDSVILSMSGAGGNASLYKPGSTPYDGMLPPDYVEMMPREAVEAFKSKTFELGKVPECVPPLEMR